MFSNANRIIPTRMGTRCVSTAVCVRQKDHPHAYGDKITLYMFLSSNLGSSPRVWGQVFQHQRLQLGDRIIPTRMGTSRVHVRFPPVRYGSSPRVWGQVNSRTPTRQGIRIIPTRMGTRASALVLECGRRDHPHAYGDKRNHLTELTNKEGSSPRVWGQAFYNVMFFSGNRIIPTRMGTSTIFKQSIFHTQDHPHAYGDKPCVFIMYVIRIGSSPRVWGQVNCTRKT